MPRVGRRREKKPELPPGVQEKAGTWYWAPTSKRERDERRKLREAARERGERLPIGVTLGPANSRQAWRRLADVSGRALPAELEGTLLELTTLWRKDSAGLPLQANGEPRATSTIQYYEQALEVIEEKWGRCRYGKTAQDAARGQAMGTSMIQEWVDAHEARGMLKREFATLDNVFAFAIRRGRTTYNPCADVAMPAPGVREREPLAWEVEVLRTLARPRMGLQMDFEEITGWRIGDILILTRAQATADGVRVRYRKRGKRWLWEWTPELRRIWSDAESLPGATPFPASPVFPSRDRGHLSYDRFNGEWQDLRQAAGALLADGIVDPDSLTTAPGLAIVDLHFHDLRSKAHDDAEDMGREGHELLGNSAAVARKHYRRRARRVRPLK